MSGLPDQPVDDGSALGDRSRDQETGRPGVALTLVGGTAVLALLWLLAGWIGARPGYDSSWHLIWAGDLLAGRSPSFDGWAAPTEHPLMLAISLIAAPFGSGAGRMLVALDLLALLAILPAAIRLSGSSLGSRAAGAVGWLLLAGAYGLLLNSLRGYLDVWFVLLVVWAAARMSERGSGAGAVQLGLAGLLRPEGWLLAALATFQSWRTGDRSGARANALATVLPPIVWFGFDAAFTGRPFLSLETARTLALEGDGGGAVHVLVVSLFGGVRGPVTLLGVAGLILAWRVRGSDSIRLQAAIGATGLAVACAISVLGLTLLPRYLMLTWLALALMAGFAIAGWTGVEPGSGLHRRWRIAGSEIAAAGLLGAIVVGAPSKLSDEVRVDRAIGSDLTAILSNPSVRDAMRCGPVTVPSFRLVPDVILELDPDSVEVRARGQEPKPQLGVAILVTGDDARVQDRYSRPGIALPVDEEVPPGFRPVATEGDLSAFVRCNPLSR